MNAWSIFGDFLQTWRNTYADIVEIAEGNRWRANTPALQKHVRPSSMIHGHTPWSTLALHSARFWMFEAMLLLPCEPHDWSKHQQAQLKHWSIFLSFITLTQELHWLHTEIPFQVVHPTYSLSITSYQTNQDVSMPNPPEVASNTAIWRLKPRICVCANDVTHWNFRSNHHPAGNYTKFLKSANLATGHVITWFWDHRSVLSEIFQQRKQ